MKFTIVSSSLLGGGEEQSSSSSLNCGKRSRQDLTTNNNNNDDELLTNDDSNHDCKKTKIYNTNDTTTTINNEHNTILILDNNNSCVNTINCNTFQLLKNKFSKQQLGKKLWLENRELYNQYDYIPIEFSKDKQFIMNFINKQKTKTSSSHYTEHYQKECWDQIGDELKNDIDMILNFALCSESYSTSLRGGGGPFECPLSESHLSLVADQSYERMKELIEVLYNSQLIFAIGHLFDTFKMLSTNQELLLEFIKKRARIFKFADETLKNDRKFILNAISTNEEVFYELDDSYFDDKEIVLHRIRKYSDRVDGFNDSDFRELVSDRLKMDRDVILEGGKKGIDFLKHQAANKISYENDREFALQMVQCFGSSLKYFSDTIKNDREIVLLAVKNGAIEEVSKEFQLDREMVIESVKYCGYNIRHHSETYQNDREIVLMAIQNSGGALTFLCSKFQNDREIVLEAVKESGSALEYASDELKNDREIVLQAVKKYGDALVYASTELRNDREVVLEAIKYNSFTLRFASKELRNDREIVLQAVKEDGSALEYASKGLQNDIDLLLKVVKRFGAKFLRDLSLKNETALQLVKQNGLLLEFLPEEFKSNYEIVEASINENPISIMFSELKGSEYKKIISNGIVGMINSKYAAQMLKSSFLKKVKDIELAYQLVKCNPLAIHYLNLNINEKIGFKATLLENGYWMKFSEDHFQERIIHEYYGVKIDCNNEINYYRNRNNNTLWSTKKCKWPQW